MSSLGIYFGQKFISVVETKGSKLSKCIQIPHSAITATGEIEEKVPTEDKIIEIIALFKDELRRNKIQAREATLCLSGGDLIIRSFEMPIIPRSELQNAVCFEARKYIPFKVEDLIFDFQVKSDKAKRSNIVLFVGIKREILEKYISILKELSIKIRAIEFATFSILRCLKLSGLDQKGIVGIVSADVSGEDEASFAVLDNGFPLFSRDIVLAGAPAAEGEKAGEAGAEVVLEKLKTELRISLDYYHRKFPSRNIKKVYFISDADHRPDLEAFVKDLGLSVQFIDISRYLEKSIPYSSGLIKGYSASLYKKIRTYLKLDLLVAKEKEILLKHKPTQRQDKVVTLKRPKLNSKVVLLGLLICALPFGFGLYKMRPLHEELNNIIAMRPQVTTVSPEMDLEELTGTDSEYKRKLGVLDKLIKEQLYLTEPFDIIPRIIPEGTWLTNLQFQEDDRQAELILRGMVYLNDSEMEFEAVNKFQSELKNNSVLAKYFTVISLSSIDNSELDNLTVTTFSISCRRYK